jgi:uncharacterized membrane protein
MFCHSCGTQVTTNDAFCPRCGQSLAPRPPDAPTPVWQPPAAVQSHTGRWISGGWQLIKGDIGLFALLTLVFIVLGSVVPVILQGPMAVGFHYCMMKKIAGRQPGFDDLFKGFNYFVPALVASLLISLLVFAGTLACLIPGLVVAAALKFTYIFIIDKRMDFWPAIQASHAVVKSDYVGFTLFLLAMAGVNILGFLCLIVGLLVTIPLSFAAITLAYREIVGFDEQTVAAM